jgi:hypothetical protein
LQGRQDRPPVGETHVLLVSSKGPVPIDGDGIPAATPDHARLNVTRFLPAVGVGGVTMAGVADQVLTIVGVVVGAAVSYLAGNVNERIRWRRERATRLDDHRTAAYAAYGRAVKACFSLAARIAAARGLNSTMLPLPPDHGIVELDRMATERERQWEQVLLLGDPETIAAARAWHQTIWHLEWYARGRVTAATAEGWEHVVTESGRARDRFYRAARRSLGIPNEDLPPDLWPPAWLARQIQERTGADEGITESESRR